MDIKFFQAMKQFVAYLKNIILKERKMKLAIWLEVKIDRFILKLLMR